MTAIQPATDADIAEIIERHARALPGRYKRPSGCNARIVCGKDGPEFGPTVHGGSMSKMMWTADFMVGAHQDIPALVERIRQDGEKLKQMEEALMQADYTLEIHGHIDADTDLHRRIRTASMTHQEKADG